MRNWPVRAIDHNGAPTDTKGMGEASSQLDVWVEVTPASNAGGAPSEQGAADPSGALPITGAESLLVALPALVLLLVRYVMSAALRRVTVGEAS